MRHIIPRALVVSKDANPHAFDFSQPYMVVGVVGCVFWALAYLFAIHRNWRDKTYSIPATAICLNIGWEFLTAWVLPDPLPIWVVLERAWFLLDVVIVVQLFMYGARSQIIPELRRFWMVTLVVGIAFSTAGQWTFIKQYRDALAFIAGFLANAVMSAYFVLMYFSRRESGSGLSKPVAWCKMLGTLGTAYEANALLYTIDPELRTKSFFWFLWFTITVLDVYYIWLLYQPVPLEREVPAVSIALE